jgi:hypothetical protein
MLEHWFSLGMEEAPLVAVGLKRLKQGRHPGDQLVDHAAIMAVSAAAVADGRGVRRGVTWLPRTANARSCAARLSDSSTGLPTTEFSDGSMSGQLGDDRSERISGVGADDDI